MHKEHGCAANVTVGVTCDIGACRDSALRNSQKPLGYDAISSAAESQNGSTHLISSLFFCGTPTEDYFLIRRAIPHRLNLSLRGTPQPAFFKALQSTCVRRNGTEIIGSTNLKPKGEKDIKKERSVVEGADCCESTLSG